MTPQEHRCVICDWTGPLPEDAVQLTNGASGKPVIYEFSDGTVHSLKKIKARRAKESK